MKICIPTGDDRGLDAPAYDHFGSAPYLTVVDTDGTDCQVIRRSEDRGEPHSCTPVSQLQGHAVDAVVCSGVGRRALFTLRQAGIDVLTPADGRVADIIAAVKAGATTRLSEQDACGGNRGGCHH